MTNFDEPKRSGNAIKGYDGKVMKVNFRGEGLKLDHDVINSFDLGLSQGSGVRS